MKRILLASFLLTATYTLLSFQHTTAQTITQSSFMAKVNKMDTYIGVGDTIAAKTTWNSIHADMLTVLSVTKNSIRTATTPTDVTNYTDIMTSQKALYRHALANHTDLVTHRSALYTDLSSFDAMIY